MTDFDAMIKNLALHVRAELAKVEYIPHITFSVSVTGRTHDGDLKVQYSIGSSYEDGGSVNGGQVDNVLEEYMRRFGWDKRNKPLTIGYVDEADKTQDDEIPF